MPAIWRSRINIENGNYLYKNKLKFDIQPSSVRPEAPTLPPGLNKEDPVFGMMEIYRQGLRFDLPIIRDDPSVRDITLAIAYQGCAASGFCYPPRVPKSI